jgi:hypothetical protein
VFWEFRQVRDGAAGQWARLAARLSGIGVPSLDDAMREVQLEPVHAPLRAVFAGGLAAALIDGIATAGQLDTLEARFAEFLSAVAAATAVEGDAAAIATEVRRRTERIFVGPPRPAVPRAGAAGTGTRKRRVAAPPDGDRPAALDLDRSDRAALLAWLGLGRAGALAPGDMAATSLAWYDDLRLPGALVAGLHATGFGEGEAWAIADLVRVLLTLPRRSTLRGRAGTVDARLIDAWLANDTIRVAIGVNIWEGVEYLDRDRFAALLGWATRLDAIDTDASTDRTGDAAAARLAAAAEAAGYRVDGLRAALRPTTDPRGDTPPIRKPPARRRPARTRPTDS